MGPSAWPAKVFKARITVPDRIPSCFAIALTLIPRWRSLTTFLAVEHFLGTDGRPDFVPCFRSCSRPAITRYRITDLSSSAMAAMMVNMAFPIGVLVSSASW